ncbi:LOW QUALITY PROTEIN: PDZ domain-containing RING finger protein 4-like [Pollicipes pollicipes]|uniref:LOW QUALITY PROTEIN: PDZ domain-containing RING finger protein 4-like n=1 Tax=Pollicipes pollicipes TaxID=41117 RepID=UPI001884F618|nr:LOW QUALITY PROTEIN: PDZ domain-containing RING finger protein 4-like [Pollicipes pollicipes]
MAASGGAEPRRVPSPPAGLPVVYERDPTLHDCTVLLQNYVQAQQQQIAILEQSLADMARNFGTREQALLGQISTLTQQLNRVLADKVTPSPSHFEARDLLTPKVNGQDVSKASHEEAVRAFQAAQEPIVVEVRRRPAVGGLRSDANRNPKPAPTAAEQSVTVSTQTESWPCCPEFPPAPPFDELDHIDESFEDAAEPDVDFEEVTLQRSSTSERLGLTLYYPDGEETPNETDVLVRSVEAGGIAASDGRIQPGDQIIQINGEEVTGKEQAERLLAARPDVLLLLCRPAQQTNEEVTPLEQSEAHADLGSPQVNFRQDLDNRVADRLSPAGGARRQRDSLEKRDTMKSGSSSGGSSGDSGVRPAPAAAPGRAAGELTIDRELYLVNKQMTCIQQECESLARRQGERRRGVEDHIYETIAEGTEPDEPVYCQPYAPADAPPPPPPPGGAARSRRDVERWVRATAAEPAAEPEEGWHRTSSTNDSQSSAESRPARRERAAKDAEEKDSSSAYNTGDSSRSTPLTLELGLVADEAGREARQSTLMLAAPTRDLSLQVSLDSDTYSEVSCKNCRKCMRLPPLQQTPTKNKNVVNSFNAVEKNRNYVTFMPYQTHYTNAANLEETMQQQQRQLYQQIMRRSQPRALPGSPGHPNARAAPAFGATLGHYRYVSSPGGAPRNHSLTLPADRGPDEPQFQYKVKVRSDGSRYIARRPVRKQQLRERAARIAEERTGITTDDDAVSELKLGRYWPRDEKKRQLERARERKQKQQQRTKMAAVPEEGATEEPSVVKRQANMHPFVETSLQRRSTSSSMRNKSHGQEEFLKHAKPPKTADALLSVTTV